MVFEADEKQRKTYSRPRNMVSIMYFLVPLELDEVQPTALAFQAMEGGSNTDWERRGGGSSQKVLDR